MQSRNLWQATRADNTNNELIADKVRVINKLIISRTDGIGDVVLTLPLLGAIKKLHPSVHIVFLGRKYTSDVIKKCEYVDEFIDFNEIEREVLSQQIDSIKSIQADAIFHIFPNKDIARIAKYAGMPLRVGTKSRWYHWLYCNKLLNISRKNSVLHEAQLNLLFTQVFENRKVYELIDIPSYYGFSRINIHANLLQYIDNSKFNLIIHPKSKGSSREWNLDNYNELIHLLPQDRYKIFITGTAAEKSIIQSKVAINQPNVVDLVGDTTLSELIEFISHCDGLVATSTGTLHIAAMAGIHTIGLYPPIRPLFPQRWAPIGVNARYLVNGSEKCNLCKNNKICHCINSITPTEIANVLNNLKIIHK
ncbi:MAG: glycosyltransferase family 9 protein [Ignavibacteria bacterium]|jgi:ADP-heptose:LPS heptosyltransferase|nr:glycosyltransferase family 9 protein [Ignavibacteria bacterium]